MILSRRSKESIKTALAMVIAYGIALQMGWDRPYWAAFAVGMISLPEAGASLQKGVFRMSGTLVAGVVALALIALFSQQRWWFMLVLSLYLGFCTYMMMGKKNQYFYQASAFVCAVICFDSLANPMNGFATAVTRVEETAMGILVYSLIVVFLWPIHSRDELNQTCLKLVKAQHGLFKTYRLMLTGRGSGTDFRSQSLQTVQLLTQFEPTLNAAEADSFDVRNLRQQWRNFLHESKQLLEVLVRCQANFPDIEKFELHKFFPNVTVLSSELEVRLEQIEGILSGDAPGEVPQSILLVTDHAELAKLSHFEKAALAVTREQLRQLEALTRELYQSIAAIKSSATLKPKPLSLPREESLSTGWALDPDRFAGAIRIVAGSWLAFLIWIYIDPPGHAGFVSLAIAMGVAMAKSPQLSVSAVFLPVLLGCLFASSLYLFVMPHLVGFVQLGTMIFVATFAITYLCSTPKRGLMRSMMLIYFIVIISIDNQQTYSFSQAANTTLEALLTVALLVVCAYIPYNRQPEKMFLRMLHRFFRQAGFLVSPPTLGLKSTMVVVRWWEKLRSRNDLLAIPDQLGTWGAMVDQRENMGDSSEQLPVLATRLHMLGHRLQELIEARRNPQGQFLVDELQGEVQDWRFKMQKIFQSLAKDPAAFNQKTIQTEMDRQLTGLEVRIKETMSKATEGQISDRDSENFYRLLGAYRGVSEAIVAYTGIAGTINWSPWYEEKF